MAPRNKLQKIYYIFITITIGLLSCQTKTKKDNIQFFNLNGIKYDTLFMYHQDSHCGEWGGDAYTIKVFRQKSESLVADLNVLRKTCDDSGITTKLDTSTYQKRLIVNEDSEKLIQECLNELLGFKMSNNTSVGHSGTFNASWRSDSTFTLQDYPSRTWTNFDKLIKMFEKR